MQHGRDLHALLIVPDRPAVQVNQSVSSRCSPSELARVRLARVRRLTASLQLVTGVPLPVYLISGSAPRRPMSIVIWNLKSTYTLVDASAAYGDTGRERAYGV